MKKKRAKAGAAKAGTAKGGTTKAGAAKAGTAKAAKSLVEHFKPPKSLQVARPPAKFGLVAGKPGATSAAGHSKEAS